LRFYVDGLELDVQDPAFQMDDKEYNDLQNLYYINTSEEFFVERMDDR